MKQKLSAVESKLDASEKKLSSFENSDKVRLENKIMALTKANKSLSQDIVRMKNFTSDYQSKYAIQSKKKNTEIQQLRDRLSDKSMGRASMGSDVNYSLVYNNNPSINNPNGGPLAALGEPLKKEYENIMTDLSVLIENLILENYKFSKFIQLIATYFSELNVNISSFNSDKSSIDIPNPSTMIDFESLQTTTHVSQNESTDELESFDSVAKPLLNSVYRNFHYIVDLVEHLRRQNNEDPQIINNLENELAIVRKNWQDAITTLENWKKYKE